MSAPAAARAAPVAIDWDGRRLRALDQTLLPAREVWLELDGPTAVVDAIARLAVRGAPLLGVVGGYGMAMAAAIADQGEELRGHAAALAAARPTAVNLPRAVDRVLARALAAAPAQRARGGAGRGRGDRRRERGCRRGAGRVRRRPAGAARAAC